MKTGAQTQMGGTQEFEEVMMESLESFSPLERQQRLNTRIRRLYWAAGIMLGLLQAWTSRMTIVDDTVNFLDMGDHIWRGHWSMAVNGMWNPLYAAILGVMNGVLRPSAYWEYPLVHLVLFFIFLFTLWCFDSLLLELISLRQSRESTEELSIPVWVWLIIGYTLFLWSSLQLIGVKETNPDMLVAAFFYLACKSLIRIGRGSAGWLAYSGLGLALGLGYLSKAIMFPVSAICLGLALILGLRFGQGRRACSAILVFLVVCGPFIAALSSAKGRFTFGESGRYNHAVYVNHVPALHWQGEAPGSGQPLHSTRQIFAKPAAFEFATPLDATYPAWYDVSYWYDGLRLRINLRNEVKNFVKLGLWEVYFLLGLGGSLAAGLFVLFYVSGRKYLVLRDISGYSFLLLPGLGALSLYALIHVEPRYLAPFLTMTALPLFFAVRLPASADSRRVCAAVALFILLMFVSPTDWLVHDVVKELQVAFREFKNVDPNSHQRVAEEMGRLGLRPGDHIASLEYSSYNTVQWAYLARVKIIAEIYYWPNLPDTLANNFWKADPVTQERVIQAFAKTGARAIVSQSAPPSGSAAGWSRAGNSQYYLYWLDAKHAATSADKIENREFGVQ
jgi:hypothetical protein